jgi:act minimal PKS acyl carrier protein
VTEFTVLDLKRMLETSAGDAGVDWTDITTLGTPFEEIGYDSIALLELSALVQREYGIRIPDDTLAELPTPGTVIEYLNRRAAEV